MKTLVFNLSLSDQIKEINSLLRPCFRDLGEVVIIDLVFFEAFMIGEHRIPRKMLKDYMTTDFIEKSIDKVIGFAQTLVKAELPDKENIPIQKELKYDLYFRLIHDMPYLMTIDQALNIENPQSVKIIHQKPSPFVLQDVVQLIRSRNLSVQIYRPSVITDILSPLRC